MAYIHDFTYASDDADTTSHTCVLPDFSEGDLLIWLVSKDSSTGTHLAIPSGWTSIYRNSLKNEMMACYKIATASETAPDTSSSDADAWQSSMYSVRGADATTPITDKDAVINTDSLTYTTYTYYTPVNTAVGNLHFAFLSPSGVGGCSIENYGKRYINEETTSMGMVVHVDTITDTANVPAVLGASQHTNAGMLQFEVIDDGNNLSKPSCFNDFDILELATDGMVNGSTLGNTSLTTLDGLTVVAPAYITQNAGDTGFYPIQKAPYAKGAKGLQYSAMELYLSASVDLSSDLFVVSVYPYKPKYQPVIGYGTQGRFVYLMDVNGNYKAFNIDSADNKLLNFAMQFSYAIDPTSAAFASSGTLDLTAVTKIGFGERSRSIVSYYAFNRLYKYRKSIIKGGSSEFKASFETLLEHQDGSYYRPNLLQGSDILVQVPIEIGDGTVDTFLEDRNKIIEYPSNYNVVERDYLFHQNANRSGINFNLTAASTVLLESINIQSKSEFYFTSSNNYGSININSSKIKGSGNIVLTSNINFNKCSFIDNDVIKGDIKISNSELSDPKNLYLIDTSNLLTFINIKLNNYTGKHALFIPAAITSITLDNILFDGTGTDIYWTGTSGTLTVNSINGTNSVTSSTSGGTVDIVNTVQVKVKIIDAVDKSNISNARVLLKDTSGTIFNGLTDVNGEVIIDYNYTADETITGTVRKSSHVPFYKTNYINGTMKNTGFETTILMIKDQ